MINLGKAVKILKKSLLKDITGKKIRRQYFNVPLIILYSMMIAIPYSVFIIAWGIGFLARAYSEKKKQNKEKNNILHKLRYKHGIEIR